MGQEPDKQKIGKVPEGYKHPYSTGSKFSQPDGISDWLERKEKKRFESNRANASGRARPLLKKAKLKKVSKKQNKKNLDYSKSKKEFFKEEDNRKCAICGTTSGLSIHHIGKRGGDNISDKSLFITLCMTSNYMNEKYPELNTSHAGGCHGFIEGNKSFARENEYLI